jgi:hypothetical protein
MGAWLFIGVALIVLGHLIARRIETRAVAPIVQHIRLLRLASTRSPRREPAGPEHPRLQSFAPYYESTSRELASRGFVGLGDLVEYKADGTEAGVARWFAAEDGTTSGWFAMVVTPKRSVPVMMLITELVPTRFVVTQFGASPNELAVPPTVQRTRVEQSLGLDAAIEAHRRGIAALGPASARPVHSRDDAIAVIDSLRSHVSAWRAQRTPAELLDLDLRSMLPERYHELQRLVKRSMPQHA